MEYIRPQSSILQSPFKVCNKRMAEVDELNDLLGGSDDEEVSEPQMVDTSELDNLLGGDEDDSDQIKLERDLQESRINELDKILGISDEAPSVEQKVKTTSTMKLPLTYEIDSKDSTYFLRTPNFIKMQPDVYDRSIHNTDAEKEQFGSTAAVVRWRYKTDANGALVTDSKGNFVRESNAKLIRWEDGTTQLIVGDAVYTAKMVATKNW